MPKQYRAVRELDEMDNFKTSIYEEGHKGLLIARCNQNGRYPWQAQAILHGLRTYRIGKKNQDD